MIWWGTDTGDYLLTLKRIKITSNFASLSKKVNPYKACIYRLCRDFLDGVGYDLGTKYYESKNKLKLGSVCISMIPN